SREAKLNSYEMVARHVFPHFQGHNIQREESNAWVRDSQKDFKASHNQATAKQIERHNKQQDAKAKSKSAAE
ncbi:MAG: LLM class flavin-dependent oxidoreductase, partial [Rhodospirillaceae bacterium]|nr:LLM class flavin-dependent oxidoreductase [Rhodospirillaceae bacterium]